jgi:hypothetical protein
MEADSLGCGLGPISGQGEVSAGSCKFEVLRATYPAVDVEVGESSEAVDTELLVQVVGHWNARQSNPESGEDYHSQSSARISDVSVNPNSSSNSGSSIR